MKVMSICESFIGDPGPTPPWGAVLTVKDVVRDQGDAMYVFKQYPGFCYDVRGFIPLSKIDERKLQIQRGTKYRGLF